MKMRDTHLLAKLLDSLNSGSEIRNQLAKGGVAIGFMTACSLLLSLLTSIILARTLGPVGFGRYAFAMAVASILSLPVGAGMFQFITRETARLSHDKEWPFFAGLLRRATQWGMFLSLLFLGALGFLAFSYSGSGGDGGWSSILVAALLIPVVCLHDIRAGALRGLGHVIYAKLPELMLRPGVHLLTISIIVVFGAATPEAALGSQVFAAAMALLLAAFLLRTQSPFKFNEIKRHYRNREWLCSWRNFSLLMGAGMLNTQVGLVFLGWLAHDSDVAALKLAGRGAQFVIFPLVIVNMVIAPQIVKSCKANNHSGLQNLSRHSARIVLAGTVCIALPLLLFGAAIIGFLFGAEYVADTTAPMLVMILGQTVNAAFGSVGMFLTMSGHERDTFFGQICGLLVNCALALLLIPHYGATGAACAGAAALVVWNVVLAVRFKQRLGLRPTAFA